MTYRTAQHVRTQLLPVALAAASIALCVGTQATTIAHWRFEEGPLGAFPTTISDSSDNGHHGTAIRADRVARL